MLPNGLTVLTKEVHAAPVVYFSVYYKVGSLDEEVGETGMSHLMEHMMFKGTKTRGPGVISATLQNNGADFNASTSFDRTEYHETLAADRLELAMQIESDRMVNSAYDEAQHQKEMSVVRSEYEAGENDPGTALGKAVRLAAFQVNPYRWETIGFKADIENFTRDEMYAYYQNYYTPNNAVVVIVGDFDTAKALDLARRYFGPIPPHPVAQHFITPEPVQEGERRVVVRRAGSTPQMMIAYHIPGFGDPDRYALDVLETVLSGGRTSRFGRPHLALFQDLEQTGLSAGADAYDYGLRDPDLLFLSAVAQPGHTNPELEKALLAEVDQAANDADHRRRTDPRHQPGRGRLHLRQGLRGVAGRGPGRERHEGRLALRRDLSGQPPQSHPGRRAARGRQVPDPPNRTVGYFEPILPANGEAAPPPSLGGGATTAPVARFKPARVPPADYFKTPARLTRIMGGSAASGGAFNAATAPLPTKVVLPNGLTVVVQENHANPTVSLSGALLSAGGVFDPPAKRGLAAFTASQLSRGTAEALPARHRRRPGRRRRVGGRVRRRGIRHPGRPLPDQRLPADAGRAFR